MTEQPKMKTKNIAHLHAVLHEGFDIRLQRLLVTLVLTDFGEANEAKEAGTAEAAPGSITPDIWGAIACFRKTAPIPPVTRCRICKASGAVDRGRENSIDGVLDLSLGVRLAARE